MEQRVLFLPLLYFHYSTGTASLDTPLLDLIYFMSSKGTKIPALSSFLLRSAKHSKKRLLQHRRAEKETLRHDSSLQFVISPYSERGILIFRQCVVLNLPEERFILPVFAVRFDKEFLITIPIQF